MALHSLVPLRTPSPLPPPIVLCCVFGQYKAAFVHWQDGVAIRPELAPQTELGRELYDHRGDTGMWLDWPGEEINLAHDPRYESVVAELHKRVLEYIRL